MKEEGKQHLLSVYYLSELRIARADYYLVRLNIQIILIYI
jgi:hypothetical protein